MTRDATSKRARRAAYAAYVELYWHRARLVAGDPARAALAEATRRAEVRWRALMRPASDAVVPDATGDRAVAAVPTVPARPELLVPPYDIVALSGWGD